jgi:hypothetical protein
MECQTRAHIKDAVVCEEVDDACGDNGPQIALQMALIPLGSLPPRFPFIFQLCTSLAVPHQPDMDKHLPNVIFASWLSDQ